MVAAGQYHVAAFAAALIVLTAGCRQATPRPNSPRIDEPGPSRSSSAGTGAADRDDWRWCDASDLLVEGKGWAATARDYQRLPDRAEKVVPENVWKLSRHTAGLCVRFISDSERIAATWDGGGAMNHMAATGNSGLDLYQLRDGRWEFCGVGKPRTSKTTAVLARNLPTEPTEYLLYLPLYHEVTELRIGVLPGAALAPAAKRSSKPIVFYGTSITQGGCASRAGMCHPAILGRRLDREVINLGFSGAGKMEPELADLLAELDAALYVLECLPNMTTDMVRERVAPFVRRLREARPIAPILLVENPIHPAVNPGNHELRKVFDELTSSGVPNLHYLPGDDQLAGPENGTVDGVHPTDLGFSHMAGVYEPVLRRILSADAPTVDNGPQSSPEIGLLPGFQRSSYFDEQIRTYTFEPDVTVHINAPSAATFDARKPTRVVLYALPNGNTIAQTVGRQRKPDVDWHFFIQHIGAQTRRLREVNHDENLVVAYLEAAGRSWPLWRQKHENAGESIARLVESLKSQFAGDVTVDLTGHSGGGSFIFGYMNHVDEIPDWIGRIVLLDANYSYNDEQHHGEKLLVWLRRSPQHFLGVIAYDDRRIRLDGKLVVGPTGGTYRATQRMLDRLIQDLAFTETEGAEFTRYRALDGRVDIVRVANPEDKILHTVLVEKNGFIHGLTFATPLEGRAGEFWGPAAYTEWIQPD